jgi:cell wall-associated NlpC family hydrolase
MDGLMSTLPVQFHCVRYDGARIPDGQHDLSGGANCQRYAYAVLAHFGISLPPWRSSELWADEERTRRVTSFEPLDLLLFNRDAGSFGAHVAVYAGAGQAVHLARSVGRPVVWSLTEFAERDEYRVLIGGKRALL